MRVGIDGGRTSSWPERSSSAWSRWPSRLGTTYALLDPGYVFEDDELLGEITVFVLGAALAVGCALLARRHNRRRTEQVSDPENWLPPEVTRTGEGQVDLEVETARLQPLALRALGLVLVWLIVFAGVVFGFVTMAQSSDKLLATGTRVYGTVLSAYHPSKGTATIDVTYPVGNSLKEAEVVWDSDHRYAPGQSITVIYDPADPSRVRTLYETNDDQFWVWVFVIGLIAALSGIPIAGVAASKWGHRYRAVRRTGWRVASVTVVPDYPVRRGRHAPDIHVEYADGSRITLRTSMSSHGAVPLKNEPDRRAWVGGADQDMVVLFPHGRWRPTPYAVPAYALTARTAGKRKAAHPVVPEIEPEPQTELEAAVLARVHKLRTHWIVAGVGWSLAIVAAFVLIGLDQLGPAAMIGLGGVVGLVAHYKLVLSPLTAEIRELGEERPS